MAIADSTGNVIATYSYNEWGEVTVNASGNNLAIANINPLRYRGYYFDSETGYYYLQSRYYDPEICRFINADLPEYASEQKGETAGINIFVYCCNDAVNNSDPSGYKYDPSKARQYADNWWDTKNGTYFNSVYGFRKQGDCANFVSQCLYAGGLSNMTGFIKSGWHCNAIYQQDPLGRFYICGYNRSDAWQSANCLRDWLLDKKYISNGIKGSDYYVLKSKRDVTSVGKKIKNKARCSAVIFFDYNNDGNMNHATILGDVRTNKKRTTYNIYYYGHTADRRGERDNSLSDPTSDSLIAFFKAAKNKPKYKKARVYIYLLKY